MLTSLSATHPLSTNTAQPRFAQPGSIIEAVISPDGIVGNVSQHTGPQFYKYTGIPDLTINANDFVFIPRQKKTQEALYGMGNAVTHESCFSAFASFAGYFKTEPQKWAQCLGVSQTNMQIDPAVTNARLATAVSGVFSWKNYFTDVVHPGMELTWKVFEDGTNSPPAAKRRYNDVLPYGKAVLTVYTPLTPAQLHAQCDATYDASAGHKKGNFAALTPAEQAQIMIATDRVHRMNIIGRNGGTIVKPGDYGEFTLTLH